VTLRHQLQRLTKDTAAYGLGAAVQKFITFLLFPIYARLLSQADFGKQDLVSTVVTMTSLLLVLGMDSGTVVLYYKADSAQQERILATWLWSQVLLSIPVCIVLFVFAVPVCRIVFGTAALAPYLQLGVAAIPFSQVTKALSFVLRLTFKARTFIVLTTAGVLFQVVAAIVLVVVLKLGITGVFIAILVAAVLQMLLGLVLVGGAFRPVFSWSWFAAILRVGVPLVPAALSVWVLNYAHRYFLVRYATLEDIGMLSVALRISSILLFAISAFETAWGPFAYSVAQDERVARQTYSRVLTYFLVLVFPATAALSIFGREVTRMLATSSYETGASLEPLYCFSSISWVLLFIVGMGTGIARKTSPTTSATILAAAVNPALNWWLIPSLGITGAAIATLAANVSGLVYMFVAGQHYFHVQYDFRRVLGLLVATVIPILIAVSADRLFVVWQPGLLWVKFPALLVTFAVSFLIVGPGRIADAARSMRTMMRRSPAT
jgi:O-antigen/teichoic acid export membrane protein